MANEEIGGISYVFNFYNDLENLTNHFAAFVNMRTRIKAKYPKLLTDQGKESTTKITLAEEDRQALNEITDSFRSWATRCYIKTQSLSNKIKGLDPEKVKEQYNKLIESPIPDFTTANEYVTQLNIAFVEGGLQDLLVRNKDLVEDILD